MLDPQALIDRGAEIFYEQIWTGDPPNRHAEPDPAHVRSVKLPLTPAEWCDLAMREGESYIGGCCGTSSAIQDVLNGIFREGGYADGDDLYTIGHLAKTHPDGFQEWGFIDPMTQKEFDERCARWDELAPWDKIGLCYQAVKDKVTPHSHNIEPFLQENRPDLDEAREIRQLYACLALLRYARLRFVGEEEDKRGQKHADHVLTLAKMLPGTRTLLRKLEEDFTTWSGYAIVEKARPEVIAENGYGACLYNTETDAKKVIALWSKPRDGEESKASKVLIRPVTISVQNGVEFTG